MPPFAAGRRPPHLSVAAATQPRCRMRPLIHRAAQRLFNPLMLAESTPFPRRYKCGCGVCGPPRQLDIDLFSCCSLAELISGFDGRALCLYTHRGDFCPSGALIIDLHQQPNGSRFSRAVEELRPHSQTRERSNSTRATCARRRDVGFIPQ
jgi:hypothetical protein